MLHTLRNAAKTWVAKALLILLMASFAIWGVSGQIATGVGGDTVLQAGNTGVSVNEYRLAYQRQLRSVQQQVGQRISREQAQMFGIDNQVLSQLVAGAVLDEQARTMRLGLSKDRLAALIAEDPAFQGVNGRFDRQQFQLILRDAEMREEDYIRSREDVAIRTQVVEAAVDGLEMPTVFMNAYVAHRGEKRDVSYLAIDAAALPAVNEPSEEALATFFDENKARYRAPEYRQVRYVRLIDEDVADVAAVAESAVRDEYEATKDRYTTPETRTIQQLVFSDKEQASVANQRILAGESFDAIVAEEGKTIAGITSTDIRKDDIPDSAIADAAFAIANAGEATPVIDGAFGPVIVRVTDIKPLAVQSFEEVESTIREQLALVEAQDIMLTVHDAYEDARASGQSLEEAAKAQKLDVNTIDAVDARGNGIDGAPVANLPEADGFLTSVFDSDVMIENPPLNAGRSGFLWYEVVDVTPDRDRSLEEVRQNVITDWKVEEREKHLDAEAERVAGLLRGGKTIEEVAEETGYLAERKFGLERTANDADFGTAGVQAVFAEGPDAVGTSAAPSGEKRFVFKVDTISAPLIDASSLSSEEKASVSRRLGDDLLDQMVGRAQLEFPVTVNQTALQRAQQQL